MDTMQKWEYRYEHRSRAASFEGVTGHTKTADWSESIPDKLNALGQEGWELVTVIARSSGVGEDFAGFTTDELWVFKRPVEGAAS